MYNVLVKPSDILRSINASPKKWFGQNFLTNEAVLDDIVNAAEIAETDIVIEIGPGLGALTERLIAKAGKVIAIEADRELAEYMRNRHLPKTTIVTGDALQIDWTVDIEGDYKIVANIPYSITSPLMRKIFHLEKRPSRVVLLIQKEVAERLIASAGSNDRGFLTMLREANADIKIVRRVLPGSFHPAPKVDSVVILLTLHENREAEIFWPAVERAFSHKRQTLANGVEKGIGLSKGTIVKYLEKLNLNPLSRPSDLSFDNWVALSSLIKEGLK